jgi:hypothetical protein
MLREETETQGTLYHLEAPKLYDEVKASFECLTTRYAETREKETSETETL